MKKTALALILAASPMAASADFLGFAAGANYWSSEPSGTTAFGNGDVDFADDLNLGESEDVDLWAWFEHPVPLIPNVKVAKTGIEMTGKNGTVPVTYGGLSANATGIDTELNLSHQDAILYWGLPIPLVDINFGLDVRQINGFVTMHDSNGVKQVDEDISATIPMGYLAAEFELPLTGLFVAAELSTLSIGDNGITDTTAMVGYETGIGFGIQGGVRQQQFTLKDAGDVEVDLTVSGPFAGVYYHF